MAKPFVIAPLSQERIPLVNRFYQQENSPHRAGRHETVVVAYDNNKNNTIIAAVRIKKVGKDQLITGLLVRLDRRKQGIGQQLIRALCCHQQANKAPCPLFAFIDANLLPLYRQCRFEAITKQQLPSLLLRNLEALNHNSRQKPLQALLNKSS